MIRTYEGRRGAARRRASVMWSCVAATALVLAACGSDDASKTTTPVASSTTAASTTTAVTSTAAPTDTSTTGGASTTTQAASTSPSQAPNTAATTTVASATTKAATPTGTSIKLMVTGTIKSTIGTFEENVSGAQAAAQALNAQGGINGHPVEIVQCNDERTAAKAAQCAQEAVDTKVAAVVGSVFLTADYYPILEAAKIPFIGGPAGFPQEITSPLSYPLTGGAGGEFSAMGGWLAGNVGKKISILEVDNPGGISSGDNAKATAEAAGATTSVVKAPAAAPDFSPFAANLLASKPDAIVLALIPTDVVPVIQALRGQGYEGPIANVLVTFGKASIDALGDAADGVYVFASWALPDVIKSPLMDRFNAEMGQYSPDALRDPYSEGAWAAVNVIATALKGSTTVDAAAVVAGLDSIKVDLVGMTGGQPFSMSPTSGVSAQKPRIFNPYVTVYKVEGGKYTLAQDFFNPVTNPTGKATG